MAVATVTGDHPPHDEEIERAVLGACLWDERTMVEVAEIINPADFYHPQNQLIARSIWRLHFRGKPVDYLGVSADLRESGSWERVAGALGTLEDTSPDVLSAAYHAQLVHDLAVKRRLLKLADGIKVRISEPVEDQVIGAMRELAALSIGQETDRSIVSAADATREVLDDALQIASGHEGKVVKTGITALDADVMIRQGQLVVVAGAPSSGKSSLALQIAEAASRSGRKVLVFSLELTRAELAERLLAAGTGIEALNIARGRFSEVQADELRAVENSFQGVPMHIVSNAMLTPLAIRTKARAHQLKHGLDMILVDYLQLVRPDEKGLSREQQVAAVSRALKVTAQDLEVPVITASQLSRRHIEEKRDPELHDLRESGGIEADADIVMMLSPPAARALPDSPPEPTKLFVRKQRQGPKLVIRLRFNGRQMRFYEMN